MRFTLALLGLVAGASAQAVTAIISPSQPPPAGCTTTHTKPFGLSIVSAENPTAANAEVVGNSFFGKRELQSRQNSNGQLEMTLNNGILTDSNDRQGYVASNFQFQFDHPPQAGAIYTAGFSVCANGTIALGGSAIWYSCSSGSPFDNLYDRAFAPYCKPVYFYAAAISGAPGPGSSVSSGGTYIPTGAAGSGNSSSVASTSASATAGPVLNSTTTAASSLATSASSSASAPAGSSAAATPKQGAAAGMEQPVLGFVAALAGLFALL